MRPRAVLCLGATAARALLGPSVRVGRDRGRAISSPHAPYVAVTIHPSAILRVREHDEREAAFDDFVADLAAAAAWLASER